MHPNPLCIVHAQLEGEKRVVLLHPSMGARLCLATPGARRSRLDIRAPAAARARECAAAAELRGLEHTLRPGEALFIPQLWWHYIEADDGPRPWVSINRFSRVRGDVVRCGYRGNDRAR